MLECPVCREPCDFYEVSFSEEGPWCNHKSWVRKTGLSRDDPPILKGEHLGSYAQPDTLMEMTMNNNKSHTPWWADAFIYFAAFAFVILVGYLIFEKENDWGFLALIPALTLVTLGTIERSKNDNNRSHYD